METEGTGLGLFIAKNIIKTHSGRTWLESEENKGATFHFVLPFSNPGI
jgi:signal transduction histidine kinase